MPRLGNLPLERRRATLSKAPSSAPEQAAQPLQRQLRPSRITEPPSLVHPTRPLGSCPAGAASRLRPPPVRSLCALTARKGERPGVRSPANSHVFGGQVPSLHHAEVQRSAPGHAAAGDGEAAGCFSRRAAEVPVNRPRRAVGGEKKAGRGEHLPGHPEALQAGTSPRLHEGRQASKQRNRSSQLAAPLGSAPTCQLALALPASHRAAPTLLRGYRLPRRGGEGRPPPCGKNPGFSCQSEWLGRVGRRGEPASSAARARPAQPSLLLLLLPPAGVQRVVCVSVCVFVLPKHELEERTVRIRESARMRVTQICPRGDL